MGVSDVNNQALQPPAQVFQLISNLSQLMAAAGMSAVLGATAGVMGACLTLIGAILMAFDNTSDLIQALELEIQNLKLDVSKQNVFQRATHIDSVMAACRVVSQNLQLRIPGSSKPVPDPEADEQLDLCRESLEALVPSEPAADLANPQTAKLWFALRDLQEQIYFSARTDQSGAKTFGISFYYGQNYPNRPLGQMNASCALVPDPTSDGLVFCSVFTLPAYLHALNVFLTAGLTLRGKFLEQPKYQWEIRRHAKFLADVYNKTLTEGLVFLPMPSNPWGPDAFYATAGDIPGEREINTWWLGVASDADSDAVHGVDSSCLTNFSGPFGCVDRFTGGAIVGSFPSIPGAWGDMDGGRLGARTSLLPPNPGFSTPENLTRFYQGLLLATLRSGKQLYENEQLCGVRGAVNYMCQLVGDQPLLPGRSLGDWSMREVLEILSKLPTFVPDHPESLGDTTLDSSGLTSLVRRLRKSCFSDVPMADDPGYKSIRNLLVCQ